MLPGTFSIINQQSSIFNLTAAGVFLTQRSRIWQAARNVLLILAGLVVILLYGVLPRFLTGIATTSRFHFRDPNDGKTPRSYRLDFGWIHFTSSDGVLLQGWYVPASVPEPRGTIIYAHGHNRTRVELLPEAVFAHGLGYDGLLFDLRHQGQSGGEITALGYWERLDVEAAVRYALDERKAARPLVLWGISMGAAAALMAAAESPDVAAVISDSTFLSYTDMIRHHAKLFLPLPSFPIADEVIYWAAWRGKFRPSAFDLQKAVERINPRPILFVAVEGDRRMPPSIARALFARATSPQKQLIILPGVRHGEGFKFANKPYEEAVRQFLSRLSPEPSASEAGQGPIKNRKAKIKNKK